MTCCILPDLVQMDGLFLKLLLSFSSFIYVDIAALVHGHARKDSSKDCRCLFMSSQGVWEIWSVIEPGCGSAVADCCDFFTRSAWVLVMIKPHANLCPLNQSVDSMSPNTWEHFSSGKWRVAFCLTWFRLMDCSSFFPSGVLHAKVWKGYVRLLFVRDYW